MQQKHYYYIQQQCAYRPINNLCPLITAAQRILVHTLENNKIPAHVYRYINTQSVCSSETDSIENKKEKKSNPGYVYIDCWFSIIQLTQRAPTVLKQSAAHRLVLFLMLSSPPPRAPVALVSGKASLAMGSDTLHRKAGPRHERDPKVKRILRVKCQRSCSLNFTRSHFVFGFAPGARKLCAVKHVHWGIRRLNSTAVVLHSTTSS